MYYIIALLLCNMLAPASSISTFYPSVNILYNDKTDNVEISIITQIILNIYLLDIFTSDLIMYNIAYTVLVSSFLNKPSHKHDYKSMIDLFYVHLLKVSLEKSAIVYYNGFLSSLCICTS